MKEIRWCYLACSFFPGLYEYENTFIVYNTYIFFSFFFFVKLSGVCESNTHEYFVLVYITNIPVDKTGNFSFGNWSSIQEHYSYKKYVANNNEKKLTLPLREIKIKPWELAFLGKKSTPKYIPNSSKKKKYNIYIGAFKLIIIIKKYLTWIKRFPLKKKNLYVII